MKKANVLQHQYAIAKGSIDGPVLATKNILICTGWYGWCPINKIAFLCHFDHPLSVLAVPRILREVSALLPHHEHRFHSVLIGGKKWFWSKCTRAGVKELVATQRHLRISVEDGPFDNSPIASRCVSVCPFTGNVSFEKLSGPSAVQGFKWFLGPMQRVEVSA